MQLVSNLSTALKVPESGTAGKSSSPTIAEAEDDYGQEALTELRAKNIQSGRQVEKCDLSKSVSISVLNHTVG